MKTSELIKQATEYLDSLPCNLGGSESVLLIRGLIAQVRFDEERRVETETHDRLLDKALTIIERTLSHQKGES